MEDERRYRKQRLAAAFRLFGKFGFGEGTAGHITARDPEPARPLLGQPARDELPPDPGQGSACWSNHEGEVVEGTWPLNLAAFVIHSQIHAARPDVVSAAHAHSVHGKAWSTLQPPARPADPGRLRVLRGPRAVRRLHRCRARHRRGQAHRPRPRRLQGGHPGQPRAPDRRPYRRRGGVVVHHHGAHLPGAAAGGGGGHARCSSARRGRRRPPARPAATAPVGPSSSRSTTRSSPRSRTCSTSRPPDVGRALSRLRSAGGP